MKDFDDIKMHGTTTKISEFLSKSLLPLNWAHLSQKCSPKFARGTDFWLPLLSVAMQGI
jgi:hypothetical protein